ncbi:MAG: phenylalanine--tRNA ligase subunit beta [Firmicutes bacterium]|nr:phenylalanine--tRNA ligase subunit beta [Bacillota bacterium]
MKAPIKWLKDYVDIDISPEELSKRLVSAGFEVEEIIYKGKDFDKVVTCKILSVEKHNDAEKLSVCKVDAGSFGSLQIVTAAKNIKAGDIVPLALDGATVFENKKIVISELRGVKSYGMFCGAEELNITNSDYQNAENGGVIIFKPGTQIGEDVKKLLNLDEYVLDISVTANRPDCQSIIGIAREAAAILNKPFKMPDLTFKTSGGDIFKQLKVSVLSSDLCHRYLASMAEDVKIENAPEFITARLKLCGIKPISNIVDITNFVLLELGHPMHAFDYSKIEGKEIIVRRAKAGERIVTLDNKESLLSENALLICDKNKPVALAGIMGGLDSGINNQTSKIVFECAKFKRDNIRKTSKGLNIRSDSSARFEKGIDSFGCLTAQNRALHLIDKYKCGKIIGGIIDVCSDNLAPEKISTTIKKLNDVLGIEVPKNRIVEILRSLNFEPVLSGDVLTCKIPHYRIDIEDYPDLAEEVIRIYGYDNIEGRLLSNAKVLRGKNLGIDEFSDTIKNLLTGQGCSEIVTYSFINKNNFKKIGLKENDNLTKAVKIFNPLSEEFEVMRTTTLPSFLNIASLNLKRKNNTFRYFEFGRVYLPESLPLKNLPKEKKTLSIVLCGKEDFFSTKGIIESILEKAGHKLEVKEFKSEFMHPNISSGICLGGKEIGYFGQVSPIVLENYDIKQKIYFAEIDFSALLENLNKTIKCKDISKFPPIDRDLAIVVDQKYFWQKILDLILKNGGELLDSVDLFDVYKGENIEKGKQSLAFSLKFSHINRTLKAEEVNGVVAKILEELKKSFGAELRA